MGVEVQDRSGEEVDGLPPALSAAPIVPDVSDETVRRLVEDMNLTGIAVLPDYMSPANLRSLQDFVETSVENAGGQYVAFTGRKAVAGTLLDQLTDDPAFLSLMHRIYSLGTGKAPPKQSLYQVLRCLKGDTGVKQALIFHFDSYVVTVLLPIIIPSSGKMGHLVMAPNLRKERPFYFLNLIDKILLDNKFTQSFLRHAFSTEKLKMKRVTMIPGNLYLFWGYRSLHTNEACDVENIRSTALFHFADPHADSALRQKLGRAST